MERNFVSFAGIFIKSEFLVEIGIIDLHNNKIYRLFVMTIKLY